MNKKIAIPLENDYLCSHFGHCQQFAIVETEANQIKKIEKVTPPEHVPGLYPRWVAQFGVTDVIAGGMGQHAINLFNAENINVYVGAPQLKTEELVTLFLSGKLLLTENSCGHDEQSGHGQGQEHGHRHGNF
jgi:predicted Fe-Mo cluster-binding NifX family protein